MTCREEKVYNCVKEMDDGRGLPASGYYSMYGLWNMPEIPDDIDDAYLYEVSSVVKNNQEELDMSEEQFAEILEALVTKGLVKKTENWNGNVLYSINGSKEKKEMSNHIVLSFSENKRIRVGSLDVGIPDGYVYMSADENVGLTDQGHQLVAVSSEFLRGPLAYQDAPIGLKIAPAQLNNAFADFWAHDDKWIRDKIANEVLVPNIQNPAIKGVVKFNKVNDNLAVSYCRNTESKPGEPEYWTSYAICILHGATYYSGMVYFNGDKLTSTEYLSIIQSWVDTFDVSEVVDAEEFEISINDNALGDYSDGNGKIDAVLVTKLFSNDVFFYNDNEITYSNGHHKMTGIQLNSMVMNNYPDIVKNYGVFVNEIEHVAEYLESNDKLIIYKNEFHEDILDVVRGDNITGMSYLDLCAWHMLMIGEDETDHYTVAIDRNLIYGLPHVYDYVVELIRTLRHYNDRVGAFDVTIASTINVDGPIDLISPPISAADQLESIKQIHVLADNGTEEHDGLSDDEYVEELANLLGELDKLKEDVIDAVNNNDGLTDEEKKKYISRFESGYEDIPDEFVINEANCKVVNMDGYSVKIPKEFGFRQYYDNRDFVAWYTTDPQEDPSNYNYSVLSFMAATNLHGGSNWREGSNWGKGDPVECAKMSYKGMQALNPSSNFIPYRHGDITGGITDQIITNECVNYHCVIGKPGNIRQFRIIFNGSLPLYKKERMAIDILNLIDFDSVEAKDREKQLIEDIVTIGDINSLQSEVSDFLIESKNKRLKFNQDWTNSASEMEHEFDQRMQEYVLKVQQAMTIGTDTSDGSFGFSIGYDRDKLSKVADELMGSFVANCQDKFSEFADLYDSEIKQIDEDMERFVEAGVDADSMKALVDNLVNWFNISDKMTIELKDTATFSVTLSEELQGIRDKWKEKKFDKQKNKRSVIQEQKKAETNNILETISGASEKYIRAIKDISATEPVVRAVDIVNHLGLAKSTVSDMLSKLKNKGLITINEKGFIYLVEEGGASTIGSKTEDKYNNTSKNSVESETTHIEDIVSEYLGMSFDEIKERIGKTVNEMIKEGEEISYLEFVSNPYIDLFRLGTGYIIPNPSTITEEKKALICNLFSDLRPIQRARMGIRYLFAFNGANNRDLVRKILSRKDCKPAYVDAFYAYLVGVSIVTGRTTNIVGKIKSIQGIYEI